jgi:hypothetical protein
MELQSGRFIASGEARRSVELGLTPTGTDRIGALPDDVLLLILVRLRCMATAARTSVLARRWHGLWTHLPELVLHGLPLSSIKAVFDALHATSSTPAAAGEVSLLDIRVADQLYSTQRVTSLLRTAAWFLPEELSVDVPLGVGFMHHPVELPCFDRATSLYLSMGSYSAELGVPPPPANTGECLFPVLTTVVLSGYHTDGLANLVAHSPCLRVLRCVISGQWPGPRHAFTIHSPSLRELMVDQGSEQIHRVDIATPMLTKLSMTYYARDEDLNVSVVAPMAEEVFWRCGYGSPWAPGWYTAFGIWELLTVTFTAKIQPSSPPLLRIDARTVSSSSIQLSFYFPNHENIHNDGFAFVLGTILFRQPG